MSDKTGQPIAILQDLQGPKIRLANLPKEGIELAADTSISFDTSIDTYEGEAIPVGFPDLHTYVSEGHRLLLSDGKIEVTVTGVDGTRIDTTVVVPGTVYSHKGINIPDSEVTGETITEKDKQDLIFGVAHKVDYIALSFVQSAEDIIALRELIEGAGDDQETGIRIIAKIERQQAVQRIDAILEEVDGIMVARGDLGIETPAADVPLVQKRLIDKALTKAKPVIVATQMLDSMQDNPRPTRAEVSDVSNAVMDHTDAVMLSNETATGSYPVETVQTMTEIIQAAENSAYDNVPFVRPEVQASTDDIISNLSRQLADASHATLILVASLSGETGRNISRFRPELPIVVGTTDERVMRQLNLSWGVVPFLLPSCDTVESLMQQGTRYLTETGLASRGDTIVVVAGEPVGQAGHVNLLEIKHID